MHACKFLRSWRATKCPARSESGTFTEELLIETATGACKAVFALASLTGRVANAMLEAVTFASQLVAPNRLQIAGEFEPFADLASLGLREPVADPALAHFVRDLVTNQSATPIPITIPDIAQLSAGDVATIRRAASVIGGHTVVGRWTPFTLEKRRDLEFDPDRHYQFAVVEPLPLLPSSTPTAYKIQCSVGFSLEATGGPRPGR